MIRAVRPDFTLEEPIVRKRQGMSPGLHLRLEVIWKRHRLLY